MTVGDDQAIKLVQLHLCVRQDCASLELSPVGGLSVDLAHSSAIKDLAVLPVWGAALPRQQLEQQQQQQRELGGARVGSASSSCSSDSGRWHGGKGAAGSDTDCDAYSGCSSGDECAPGVASPHLASRFATLFTTGLDQRLRSWSLEGDACGPDMRAHHGHSWPGLALRLLDVSVTEVLEPSALDVMPGLGSCAGITHVAVAGRGVQVFTAHTCAGL